MISNHDVPRIEVLRKREEKNGTWFVRMDYDGTCYEMSEYSLIDIKQESMDICFDK